MFTVSSEEETNQKKICDECFPLFKEDQEKSEEDTEIASFDSELDNSFIDFTIAERISSTLSEFVTQAETEQNGNNSVYDHIFSHKNIPKIPLEDYLKRIQKYSELEDSTLIIALIYIDRLLENHNFKLSKNNVHRILAASVLTAVKYNEDEILDNCYFAKIFGITTKELNNIENEFLDLIEFQLYVSEELFQLYSN